MIGKDYEYNAMANSERTLWWYRCLHSLTLRQIQAFSSSQQLSILDAGCGTGGLISFLQAAGYGNIEGFDLSPYAVEYANKTYGLQTKVLSILEAGAATTGAPAYDVIVSNDVLCLLQPGQDAEALGKLLALLRPGGILILNLPALRAGRGTHDVAVGITRRYTKEDMRTLAGDKARVRKMLYWPFFLSPVIFSVRWFQRMQLRFNKNMHIVSDVKNPPAFLNRFFYGLTSFENRLLSSKPWGSSLLTVLEKGGH